VLSGYIFVLTKSNEPVGIVKGVQGIVQMITAVPGGYACDHFRRDTVLKFSGGIGLVCAILSIVAFARGHLQLIYVAYGCWGFFCAIQRPALESLFADSIPNGERSFPMTVKYNLMNAAMVVGPVVCICLFTYYGDSWSIPELQMVRILVYLPKNIMKYMVTELDYIGFDRWDSYWNSTTYTFVFLQ